MKKISILFVACVVWIVLALAVDRLALRPVWPAASTFVSAGVQFSTPAGDMKFPQISLVVLFVLPMIVLAFLLVPYRQIRSSAEWSKAFSAWAIPMFWLIVCVVAAVVGQSLYLLTKKYLPEGIQKVAEAFGVVLTIKLRDFEFLHLNGSLSALVGLCVGWYLFLHRGLSQLFK